VNTSCFLFVIENCFDQLTESYRFNYRPYTSKSDLYVVNSIDRDGQKTVEPNQTAEPN